MREFRPSLRDHDITEQQWRVLRALSKGREMEVAEVADATCLLGPSLSRILRDLDERGLLTRRVPESDLRRGFVSISPDGSALIARVGPISESIYAALTRRYGAAKLKLLYEMLEQLEDCLTERPGARNDDR